MSICCVSQVEKSGLITGSRLGADNEYEFDELEVSLFISLRAWPVLTLSRGSARAMSQMLLHIATAGRSNGMLGCMSNSKHDLILVDDCLGAVQGLSSPCSGCCNALEN